MSQYAYITTFPCSYSASFVFALAFDNYAALTQCQTNKSLPDKDTHSVSSPLPQSRQVLSPITGVPFSPHYSKPASPLRPQLSEEGGLLGRCIEGRLGATISLDFSLALLKAARERSLARIPAFDYDNESWVIMERHRPASAEKPYFPPSSLLLSLASLSSSTVLRRPSAPHGIQESDRNA